MTQLTDKQCDDFRRLPGSFNDILRKVFEAGRMTGAQESVDAIRNTEGADNLSNAADSWKNGMLTAIERIEERFDFSAA